MDETAPEGALSRAAAASSGELMKRTPEARPELARIYEEIDASRDQIREHVEALRAGLDAHYNPRSWLEEHPWEAVAVAVAVGLYIGLR